MKNRITLLLSLALVLFIAVGCGLGGLVGSDESPTKDSSSKPADSKESADSTEKTEKEPSGEEIKVGIKECDELATYINDNSEEIEGSIVARGIVYVYKNWILGKIKEGVEKMSEEEKAKMGEACAKSFEQLKKSISK